MNSGAGTAGVKNNRIELVAKVAVESQKTSVGVPCDQLSSVVLGAERREVRTNLCHER